MSYFERHKVYDNLIDPTLQRQQNKCTYVTLQMWNLKAHFNVLHEICGTPVICVSYSTNNSSKLS